MGSHNPPVNTKQQKWRQWSTPSSSTTYVVPPPLLLLTEVLFMMMGAGAGAGVPCLAKSMASWACCGQEEGRVTKGPGPGPRTHLRTRPPAAAASSSFAASSGRPQTRQRGAGELPAATHHHAWIHCRRTRGRAGAHSHALVRVMRRTGRRVVSHGVHARRGGNRRRRGPVMPNGTSGWGKQGCLVRVGGVCRSGCAQRARIR